MTDISLPGRFEKQTEYLDNHSDTYFIGTDCELYSLSEGVYGERIMPETVDKRSFLFNSPFIHGSMMFRREVFDKERYRTLGKTRKIRRLRFIYETLRRRLQVRKSAREAVQIPLR